MLRYKGVIKSYTILYSFTELHLSHCETYRCKNIILLLLLLLLLLFIIIYYYLLLYYYILYIIIYYILYTIIIISLCLLNRFGLWYRGRTSVKGFEVLLARWRMAARSAAEKQSSARGKVGSS